MRRTTAESTTNGCSIARTHEPDGKTLPHHHRLDRNERIQVSDRENRWLRMPLAHHHPKDRPRNAVHVLQSQGQTILPSLPPQHNTHPLKSPCPSPRLICSATTHGSKRAQQGKSRQAKQSKAKRGSRSRSAATRASHHPPKPSRDEYRNEKIMIRSTSTKNIKGRKEKFKFKNSNARPNQN